MERRWCAVIRIQCLWRRGLAENMAHKRQVSTVKIQCVMRRDLARKIAERRTLMVTRIQCAFRVALAKDVFHTELRARQQTLLAFQQCLCICVYYTVHNDDEDGFEEILQSLSGDDDDPDKNDSDDVGSVIQFGSMDDVTLQKNPEHDSSADGLTSQLTQGVRCAVQGAQNLITDLDVQRTKDGANLT